MKFEPMRYRRFVFSVEILQEIMSEGWVIGDKERITCVEGLPEGAKFVWSENDSDDQIALVFEHPSWEPVHSVDDIPSGIIRHIREEL